MPQAVALEPSLTAAAVPVVAAGTVVPTKSPQFVGLLLQLDRAAYPTRSVAVPASTMPAATDTQNAASDAMASDQCASRPRQNEQGTTQAADALVDAAQWGSVGAGLSTGGQGGLSGTAGAQQRPDPAGHRLSQHAASPPQAASAPISPPSQSVALPAVPVLAQPGEAGAMAAATAAATGLAPQAARDAASATPPVYASECDTAARPNPQAGSAVMDAGNSDHEQATTAYQANGLSPPEIAAASNSESAAALSVLASGSLAASPAPAKRQDGCPELQDRPAPAAAAPSVRDAGAAGAAAAPPAVQAVPAMPDPLAPPLVPPAVPLVMPSPIATPPGSAMAPPQHSSATDPAVAATTPPAPAPAQQVSAALLSLARTSDGGQRMTLRLQPPDLGQVQIRIDRPADAPVRVDISVQRPETMTLLLRDQPQLQRALDQAGVPADGRTVTLHVTPGASATSSSGTHGGMMAGTDTGAGGNGSGSRSGQQGSAGTAPESEEQDEMPPPLARWLRAGLDITA